MRAVTGSRCISRTMRASRRWRARRWHGAWSRRLPGRRTLSDTFPFRLRETRRSFDEHAEVSRQYRARERQNAGRFRYADDVEFDAHTRAAAPECRRTRDRALAKWR